MAEHTTISWCDHTFNLGWGCWKTSPGCKFCFADAFDYRLGGDHWGLDKPRKTMGEKYWAEPRKWNRAAEKEGRRHRVFSSSMTDNFLDDETIKGELLKLWPLIRETPWLTWQLLTKRPERIVESLPSDWGDGWPNVWLGVSCENQEYADERIPILAETPAAVRFVSYEPALGPIDFSEHFKRDGRPDWLIVGGESGHDARPFNVAWARSTVDQCRQYGVAPFIKQLGANPYKRSIADDHSPVMYDQKIRLADSKGGDMEEWPGYLGCIKVREYPKAADAKPMPLFGEETASV